MKYPKSLKIDGVEYIPASSVKEKAEDLDGMDYVIVRTYSAGVFAGYLKSRKDKEVVLVNARRLWYWTGAASLSQLAMEGVTKPTECKFSMEVNSITLTEAIEVIEATEEAKESIDSVTIWKV
jgi:hypothetical protein